MIDFLTEKKSSWEKIKESGLPVVLYGMGNGADKVLDELYRLGIPVLGVTASDAFVRGQQFRGYTVKRLSEFEGEFIVAVSFATCLPDVMAHIMALREKYRVIVPCVPVFGDDIFNREFIEKHEAELTAAYNLFDGESKRIYAGCVNFMFGGELDVLFDVTGEKDEVFDGFFRLTESEDYLDLGAYRGDTIKELLDYTGGKYSSIIALEPDRRTYKKLCDYAGSMPYTTLLQNAIWSKDCVLNFNSAAGRQSSVNAKGEEINAVCIDSICAGKKVTYIKMDVEGAELEALEGGRKTISLQKPKLNLALYHRSEDVFRIPLAVYEINPDYEFHIRRHPYIPCWDMNLYCV
ncbi:MAG: FkbM family methyltransferase [Clostridia bacterium]|nr:FkbM family methyltransferase [Clostridia bacterium]